MKIIVDLECTCSDKDEFPREQMEIIEIGAVLVDSQGKELSRFQSFCKPVINPILTDFCKSLTTITQEEVDNAPSISKAVSNFDKWCSNQQAKYNTNIIASWGFFDINMFKKTAHNLRLNLNILNKFTHINESLEFQTRNKLKRKAGVGTALRILNINFEGTPHRAIDDAINIARIAYHKG